MRLLSIEEPKVNSASLDHYIHGLEYPAGRQEMLDRARLNEAQDNVMAF